MEPSPPKHRNPGIVEHQLDSSATGYSSKPGWNPALPDTAPRDCRARPGRAPARQRATGYSSGRDGIPPPDTAPWDCRAPARQRCYRAIKEPAAPATTPAHPHPADNATGHATGWAGPARIRSSAAPPETRPNGAAAAVRYLQTGLPPRPGVFPAHRAR